MSHIEPLNAENESAKPPVVVKRRRSPKLQFISLLKIILIYYVALYHIARFFDYLPHDYKVWPDFWSVWQYHTTGYPPDFDFQPYDRYQRINYFCRSLITCGLQLFFFISGLTLLFSMKSRNFSYPKILFERVLRLLIPLLVAVPLVSWPTNFMAANSFFLPYFFGSPNGTEPAQELAKFPAYFVSQFIKYFSNVTVYMRLNHLWFLVALFVFTLMDLPKSIVMLHYFQIDVIFKEQRKVTKKLAHEDDENGHHHRRRTSPLKFIINSILQLLIVPNIANLWLNSWSFNVKLAFILWFVTAIGFTGFFLIFFIIFRSPSIWYLALFLVFDAFEFYVLFVDDDFFLWKWAQTPFFILFKRKYFAKFFNFRGIWKKFQNNTLFLNGKQKKKSIHDSPNETTEIVPENEKSINSVKKDEKSSHTEDEDDEDYDEFILPLFRISKPIILISGTVIAQIIGVGLLWSPDLTKYYESDTYDYVGTMLVTFYIYYTFFHAGFVYSLHYFYGTTIDNFKRIQKKNQKKLKKEKEKQQQQKQQKIANSEERLSPNTNENHNNSIRIAIVPPTPQQNAEVPKTEENKEITIEIHPRVEKIAENPENPDSSSVPPSPVAEEDNEPIKISKSENISNEGAFDEENIESEAPNAYKSIETRESDKSAKNSSKNEQSGTKRLSKKEEKRIIRQIASYHTKISFTPIWLCVLNIPIMFGFLFFGFVFPHFIVRPIFGFEPRNDDYYVFSYIYHTYANNLKRIFQTLVTWACLALYFGWVEKFGNINADWDSYPLSKSKFNIFNRIWIIIFGIFDQTAFLVYLIHYTIIYFAASCLKQWVPFQKMGYPFIEMTFFGTFIVCYGSSIIIAWIILRIPFVNFLINGGKSNPCASCLKI